MKALSGKIRYMAIHKACLLPFVLVLAALGWYLMVFEDAYICPSYPLPARL